MRLQYRLELHFDPLSHRALLSCGSHDYMMPDVYPDQDAARKAAQLYAWDVLGFKNVFAELEGARALPVWLR